MHVTIDATTMPGMLGPSDVFAAVLAALGERHGASESTKVLRLRVRRALEGRGATVHVTNPRSRVGAELALIERTLREAAPDVRLTLDDAPRALPAV
jgi:hypothetical protein